MLKEKTLYNFYKIQALCRNCRVTFEVEIPKGKVINNSYSIHGNVYRSKIEGDKEENFFCPNCETRSGVQKI